MSNAVGGIGSTLSINGTQINEVISMSGPEISQETIDVTNLDSAAGYKEQIAGFTDLGTVNIEFNWTASAVQHSIRTAYEARTNVTLVQSLNGGQQFLITAIVESFSINTEPGSALTASAVFKVLTIGDVANVMIIGDSYGQRSGNPYYAEYLVNVGTITNNAASGSSVYLDGAEIKNGLAGWLAATPASEAPVVIINGGGNDLLDSVTLATGENLKLEMAAIFETILADGRQLIVLDIPPIADYQFWGGYSNQAERLAALADYNAWAADYVPAIGGKFVSIYDLLTDGADGIDDAYHLSDGLHVNVAGAQLLAVAIDVALAQAAVTQTTAHAVMRARPNPELLTSADISAISTLVNGVSDEWDEAVEVFLLGQSDVSAGGNALTGLKGAYTATIEAGSPSNDAVNGGMAFAAGEYLDLGFTVADLPDSIATGAMFTECSTTGVDSYVYGAQDVFPTSTGGHYLRQQPSPARLKYVVAKTLANGTAQPYDIGDILNVVAEHRGVNTGSDVTREAYHDGVLIEGPDTGIPTQSPADTNPFLLNACNYNGSVDADIAASWMVFYITNASTTPALWNTACKEAASFF